jgi:hypothetical protein
MNSNRVATSLAAIKMYLDEANKGHLPKYQCLQASYELELVIKQMPLGTG